MKLIKIFFMLSIIATVSCSSTENNGKNTMSENPAVVNSTAGTVEETISIYGLIKAESGNVYIVTNWRSRSMVTYTVTGEKKSELEKNKGKYASVSGILTKKQTWSGTIEVRSISSIEPSPDPQKEKASNFIKGKKGK